MTPSLEIGNGNWAVQSDSLLGYKTINGKYYPREMSVVRATTGTRVNAAGLVELVPYNLLQYSEMFSNVYWVKTATTISANTTTAPNGTLTADTLIETASGSTKNLKSGTFNFVNGASYSMSIYAKNTTTGRGFIQIAGFTLGTGAANVYANFNLNDGTTANATGGTATITSVGDGWYRCSFSFTCGNTITEVYNVNLINSMSATSFPTYTGDITKGIFLWGAQLVEGTQALNYLPTTDRLDIARVDYSTGSPALLVEPQRTNLALWSEDFSNGVWSKSAGVSISTNSAIAPNGLMTADIIDFGTSDRFVSQATTATTGVAITGTFYIKGIAGQTIQIAVAGVDQLFTLDGTWQRLGHTRTTTGTVFGLNVNTFGSATARVVSLWGAQLEAGNYSTSYIPTTSASVTRNADVISKTGISSLIGQTEGTMFVDFIYDHSGTAVAEAISISDGTSANRIFLGNVFSNTFSATVTTSSFAQFTSATSYSLVVGQRYKVAIAYKANDFAFYVNGVQISSGTSGSVPATSRLAFDSGAGSSNFFKPTNAVSLFPTRLTNTQCINLTTI